MNALKLKAKNSLKEDLESSNYCKAKQMAFLSARSESDRKECREKTEIKMRVDTHSVKQTKKKKKKRGNGDDVAVDQWKESQSAGGQTML